MQAVRKNRYVILAKDFETGLHSIAFVRYVCNSLSGTQHTRR